MSETREHDEEDDVQGHRYLTPEQAQQRSEAARGDRSAQSDEAASEAEGDA